MKIKDEILKLRSQGKSYRDIQEILQCSKGTVAYHCGEGQKEKTKNRSKNLRTNDFVKYSIIKKISDFSRKSSRDIKNCNEYKSKIIQRISNKVSDFHRSNRNMKNSIKVNFTTNDILDMYYKNPNCSLTGRPIKLEDTKSWELDHIVPASKGGSDGLDNCQITRKEANFAKGNLSMDEFIDLCKDVLIHHGYIVKHSDSDSN